MSTDQELFHIIRIHAQFLVLVHTMGAILLSPWIFLCTDLQNSVLHDTFLDAT
jgi:hypothetical protein